MMRPLIRRLSALTKSVPLRLILIVPFVLQIALVVGLSAWLSIQNGYQAVNEVVGQFRNETSNHIQQYLEAYIATPHIINRLNADMLHLKHLSLQDLPNLEQYLWYQIQSFDSVNEIKFGTEQGGFVAVEKLEDGSFVSKMASRATGSVYRVYILDRQGQRTQLVDQRPNYDPRQRPWYKGAAESGKATLIDVYQRFSTPKPAIDAISASLPLYDEQKNFVGIASVDLALSGISQFLHDLRIGRSSKTFIVDRAGRLIGSSTTQQIFDRQGQNVQQIKATDSQDVLIRFAARSLLDRFGKWTQITTGQQFDFNLNGNRQFVQVTPLLDDKGLDWLIVLVVPEDDFTDRIDANTQTAILICMAAFAVATGLGIYTARGIATPIFRLSQAADAIARGNFERTVMVKGAIEINLLAQSFNQMAQQLRDSFAQLARTNEELEIRVEQRTAALQASEAKFAAAFYSSPYPVCISTFAEGRFIEVNESFCRISEYCLEEIIGRTSTELNFWQSEDRARITRSLQEKKAVRDQEMEVRVKSGRIRTVLLSAEPIDLNGQTCILWVAADITDRKHIEAALQRSEEKFRNLFENSQVGIFRTRFSDGLILDANQRFANLFGFDSPDEIVGIKRTTEVYVNPSKRQHAVEFLKHQGELQNFEAQMRKRDGTMFWALYSSRLNATDGYTEGVVTDISDRKQAEATLRQREQELRLIADALPVYIAYVDADRRYRFVNHAYEVSFKCSRDEILGKSVREVLGEAAYQIVEPEIERALAGQRIAYEAEVPPASNNYISATYIPDFGSNGQVQGFYGLIANISDRKLAEEVLRQSEAQLREQAILSAFRADVNGALAQSDSLPLMLHRCAQAVVKHLNAAFTRIWTINKDKTVLELQASAGMYTRLDGTHSRVPVGSHKIGRIAQERRPLLTNYRPLAKVLRK